MTEWPRLILICGLSLLVASCSKGIPDDAANQTTQSDSADSVAEVEGVSPEVSVVLQRLSDFYRGLESVSATRDKQILVKSAGLNYEIQQSSSLIAQKPNRIAVRGDGTAFGMDMISDGSDLHMHIGLINHFGNAKSPEQFDAFVQMPLYTMVPIRGLVLEPALKLLTDDPQHWLTKNTAASKFLGKATHNGSEVERVSLRTNNGVWEYWVATGGQPLLTKIVYHPSELDPQLYGIGFPIKDFDVVVTSEFKDWNLAPAIDDQTFSFSAPANADRDDELVAFLAHGPDAQTPQSPLIGQSAPEVELEMLGGDELVLSELKDEHVVMLDFWATWCGPCVKEMPILAEVAQQFAEQGVRFYAVNQGEESADIETFLEEQELDITVALDVENQAGNDFVVEGLPTLVLIDKQGIVQAVHMGYSPNIGDQLRQELAAILAGESLFESAESDEAD